MRSRDEQVMAAICHGSNAVPLWGLVFCGWVLFDNREKSRFLVAQARQAMVFHGVFLFALFVWIVVALLTQVLIHLSAPLAQILDWLNYIIIRLLFAVYVAICIVGAVKCWNGQLFRYPLLRERFE